MELIIVVNDTHFMLWIERTGTQHSFQASSSSECVFLICRGRTPKNYITQTSLQLGFCMQVRLRQLDSLREDFGGRAFDCCFWQV